MTYMRYYWVAGIRKIRFKHAPYINLDSISISLELHIPIGCQNQPAERVPIPVVTRDRSPDYQNHQERHRHETKLRDKAAITAHGERVGQWIRKSANLSVDRQEGERRVEEYVGQVGDLWSHDKGETRITEVRWCGCSYLPRGLQLRLLNRISPRDYLA